MPVRRTLGVPILVLACLGLACLVPGFSATAAATHGAPVPPPHPPVPAPPVAPALPSASMRLEPVIVQIAPPAISGTGKIFVQFGHVAPGAVILRAAVGDDSDPQPTVMFPQNGNLDSLSLDKAGCQADKPCAVDYRVGEIWSAGAKKRAVQAVVGDQVLATVQVMATRQALPPPPLLSGDAIKDGRLTFDATDRQQFWLKILDPPGGRPTDVTFTVHQLVPNICGAHVPISLTPAIAHMEPGDSQAILVQVDDCITKSVSGTLQMTDSTGSRMVVIGLPFDISHYSATVFRRSQIFLFVLLGAVISVFLNNLFPLLRSKRVLRETLSRVSATLDGCTNLDGGLTSALEARRKALCLGLDAVGMLNAGKNDIMGLIQQSIASLESDLALARKIDLEESSVFIHLDFLSIASYSVIHGLLRAAEDALVSGDQAAADDALKDAQGRLIAVLRDTDQSALRTDLAVRSERIAKERKTAAVLWQAVGDDAPLDPRIDGRFDRLGTYDFAKMAVDGLLRAEADIFVAETWLRHVDPALRRSRTRFETFSEFLLQALEKCPKSPPAQLMIDLFRADTTPHDIGETIAIGNAKIVCSDNRPHYYESMTVTFKLTDPLLCQIPAVRYFPTYAWEFGDDTKPPANVYQCQHFFKAPKPFSRGIWPFRKDHPVRQVNVRVSVPLSGYTEQHVGPYDVYPKGTRSVHGSVGIDVVSFVVNLIIAVVVAVSVKYSEAGSTLPNEVGFSEMLTAFMLGFGLDQLRDTVNTPSTTRQVPTK